MGIFKNKNKELVMPENPTKFQKLWYTKQGRAAIKLGIWLIFILIVVILMFIADLLAANLNDIKNMEKDEPKKYSDILSELGIGDYSFEYIIKDNDYQVKYIGSRVEGITDGYRENNEGTLKYRIKDGVSYKVALDTEEPIENLYENINLNLIDLVNLKAILKVRDNQLINNEYQYIDIPIETETYNLTVTVKEEKVNLIIITNDLVEYKLSFTY